MPALPPKSRDDYQHLNSLGLFRPISSTFPRPASLSYASELTDSNLFLGVRNDVGDAAAGYGLLATLGLPADKEDC